MSKGMHILISGTVQGVFFRQKTLEQAQGLSITGWVRNLIDGRVEVEAYGDNAALQKLWQWLHIGPDAVSVTSLEKTDIEFKVITNFTIHDTGEI